MFYNIYPNAAKFRIKIYNFVDFSLRALKNPRFFIIHHQKPLHMT